LSLEYQAKEDDSPAKRILICTDEQARKAEDEMPLRVMGSGWHRVHMTVKGAKIVEASVESKGLLGGAGKAWVRRQKASAPASSHIALAGNGFVVRNIKLKPLGTKPLFNGKDLTGWKKFEGDAKRAKSQFTVAKEGLSIKNGPGDLQTTGQWSDFVLQLDCRTNGHHLNSGVFFRCIPGEYQNGYEAQIQNRKAKEPKKYTIDEYDPRTHELKGKKKIENWSQDYGTGAIYRRMPARRAVAKDREWFTMTVVARGRHFATWVNGIQVTDWTDNRPENKNARNGCRLKKGPISLQGHDPTTDLSFRNIRLVDLAEKN
ncbi:MAG: 3-keto-disaccharide hydrolase, partial [Gemmataceae bacterium]